MVVTIRLPPPEIQVRSFLDFFAQTPLKHVCATEHCKPRACRMAHKILELPESKFVFRGLSRKPMRAFPHHDEVRVRQVLHGAP